MTDVLIRDVPDDVLAGVDARANKLGLSRVEYIRRRLAADAATTTKPVSVVQLVTPARSTAEQSICRTGCGPRAHTYQTDLLR